MSRDTSRVRHVRETLLSDNWYTLKKYTFELLRRDGRWQEQSREAYDRGNGAVILLYNRVKQTVVLIRQFRFPVWINGHDGFLIEAAAGLPGCWIMRRRKSALSPRRKKRPAFASPALNRFLPPT